MRDSADPGEVIWIVPTDDPTVGILAYEDLFVRCLRKLAKKSDGGLRWLPFESFGCRRHLRDAHARWLVACLVEYDYIEQQGDQYRITAKGLEVIKAGMDGVERQGGAGVER